MPVVDIVTAMALSAILMVGGASVMSGGAEPGKLMAFIGAFMLLFRWGLRVAMRPSPFVSGMVALALAAIVTLSPDVSARPDAMLDKDSR